MNLFSKSFELDSISKTVPRGYFYKYTNFVWLLLLVSVIVDILTLFQPWQTVSQPKLQSILQHITTILSFMKCSLRKEKKLRKKTISKQA